MKLDPEWTENETRAYKGDWKVWQDFAGKADSLPADPTKLKAFMEDQVDEFDLDHLVKRRIYVITRIHEVNGFPDPFADSPAIDERAVWNALSDRDKPSKDEALIKRALKEDELAVLKAGTRWSRLRSLTLHGIIWPDHQPWYEWILETPPPLISLDIGDEYVDSYELGDPSKAISKLWPTLKSLSINGNFSLTEPLSLELNRLTLWGYPTIESSWFEASRIKTRSADLRIESIDAERFVPFFMDSEFLDLEVRMMNIEGLFFGLLKRDSPLARLDLAGCDWRGDEDLAFAELSKAQAWKTCEMILPDTLFLEDQLEALQDQGFNVSQDW